MPALMAMTAASLALRVCPANAQSHIVLPGLSQRSPEPGLTDIPCCCVARTLGSERGGIEVSLHLSGRRPRPSSASQVKDSDRLTELGSFDLTQLLLTEDLLCVHQTPCDGLGEPWGSREPSREGHHRPC